MSWSVQRCDHGEQPCWMAITLAAMLGQIGLPGGGVGIGYGSNATIGQQSSKMPNFGLPQGGNAVGTYIPSPVSWICCSIPVPNTISMEKC